VTERCNRQLRLRPRVSVVTDVDGRIALVHSARWGERLGELSAEEQAVLYELGVAERAESELTARLGPESTLLSRLRAGGWLTVSYAYHDRLLATVRPLGPYRVAHPAGPPVEPLLSRFALLRRDGDVLVLESPRCRAAVLVHDIEVMAVLHGLAAGDPAPASTLPAPVVTEIITELAWYGFVHEAAEDDHPDLTTEQWSTHELWFHARSREGFHDYPMGATSWGAERYPPPPGRREPWPGPAVPLPTPDPATLNGTFGAVLEGRRSLRLPDADNPLTLAQLSEFLHWSARVRWTTEDAGQELTLRPSPSGGALHSLEIYPVVTSVSGLAPGMYHYDPFGHALEPVPADPLATAQLAQRAGAATGAPPPQVLLIIAARFSRVMWKYQGMAYALILKDTGALMQTMYLVATAMNLAPCAIGAGDTDLFTQATTLNPLEEASVGEFTLSTRAP
jgi:SagB-type dehydrogenase family enzyme